MMLASSLRRASHAPWFTSMVTVALLVLMLVIGAFGYDGFLSPQVMLNLLIDNAFLLVVAVGMTFVILSGGIDLSVGSVLALTTMVAAFLLQNWHWPPLLVIATVLLMGAGFGAAMGAMIHYFKLQAFIVTLAGMFLARGLCYLISINSITIDEPLFVELSQSRLELGGLFISPSVVIALIVLAVAIWMAHGTRFGRAVYAIGGSESSALLMGLPVGRTKVLVYAFSGFCASVGGVLFSFYMLSGYGLHAQGVELDAIAAVVIGGTLLTGGYGYVAGTLTGVLILGVIQTLIAFDGSLSSWWTKIFIGALLFVFCVAQRVISLGALRGKTAGSAKAAPAVA
ncbi:sugar ABC transporter permease YjfF [Herbaspirillum sp. RU 5E]|jgi:simple sugar transport system permease protein|uniref:galactofuranose ABC transporter, permease protein YjfF n=1 Tax=Herbaspirillum sp. CAH-3 TaxID=2605746 RepID=UPI0012ACFAD1|nr:galactofuranose ABC transporter, permease protein YjfF [Herbaspirillum sp. CAH-3]MBW9334830.1 sugar ABC transporter permease YjfF [Herbaspirillum sp. RU 5E]MRT29583.1 sugar ABC transporter permease YjfF [Herbaspirillum sp. CAH-3]